MLGQHDIRQRVFFFFELMAGAGSYKEQKTGTYKKFARGGFRSIDR